MWIVYPSCSALQGPSEEHVVIVGDKNCNLQDASVRYDQNPLEYIYIGFAAVDLKRTLKMHVSTLLHGLVVHPTTTTLRFSPVFQTVNRLAQPITALPAARAN